MKNILKQYATKISIVLFILIPCSILLYSDPNGITGRTRKVTTSGCGGGNCHGNSATTGVTVTITGPDTLTVNTLGLYTVKITGGPAIRGGVNIAASSGALSKVDNALKAQNGELTHSSPTSFSGGQLTFQFNYKSTTTGVQTLYATGNSCNGNGGQSGDQWNLAPDKKVTIVPLTSVSDPQEQAPNQFSLGQNYPNPFNPTTTIQYTLNTTDFTTLKIYDTFGQEISTLVNETKHPGTYSVQFNGENLSSGTYFYFLRSGGITQTKKMFLVK